MIGIMGALDEEVNLICEKLENRRDVEKAEHIFHIGKLEDISVTAVKCGVGKVNAAICTQILIDRFKCDRIIFGGVAGSLLSGLKQGDVVVSSYAVQFDIDLTAFGRRHGELANRDRMIPADHKLIDAATNAFDEISESFEPKPVMMVGTIVSGDSFISDPNTIKWLQREFGASCTEMEGGAIGYTCSLNQIPFVIIRVISDSADVNAVNDFDTFVSKSSELLFSLIKGALKHMD